MTTEEKAEQLLEDVLQRFYEAEYWERKPLLEMLEEELVKFNDAVAEEVMSSLDEALSSMVTKSSVPSVVPTAVTLSDMLYNNSTRVAGEVLPILLDAQEAQSTAVDLARTLYDGYDFSDQDVLDVVDKLPNYITDYINDNSLEEQFLDIADKLKTKPLKTAVQGIADAVNEATEEALHKALEVYLQEKARYYADRVAKTEVQRAKSIADAWSMFNDDDIQLVKWELSSRHTIFDICDYYANLDMGYGKGIFPKNQYPALPLHPHCMCKVVPYYKPVEKKYIKDPTDELMNSLPLDKQKDIAGSWDKLQEYLNGKNLLDIFNDARPNYPIIPAMDLFKK